MQQDILWLNITVNNWTWTCMSVIESMSKLMEIMNSLMQWKRTISLHQPGAQRTSHIERHHQKDTRTILTIIKHGSNVWMIQCCSNPCFAQEMLTFNRRRLTG